jgi:RimJ/RimL family protein N-acetyltransferase
VPRVTRESARAHLRARVRRATIGDLEQFAQNVQSVADEGRYIFTEEVTADRKKSMGKLISDRSCLVIVAEVGAGRTRKLVGSLTLDRYGNVEKTRHLRVLGMLVIEGFRGMGVGTKMVAYALKWARSRDDVEKVVLGVFSNNRRALRLYEKFGFRVEGVKKKHYYIEGKHEDEIDMALFLR